MGSVWDTTTKYYVMITSQKLEKYLMKKEKYLQYIFSRKSQFTKHLAYDNPILFWYVYVYIQNAHIYTWNIYVCY